MEFGRKREIGLSFIINPRADEYLSSRRGRVERNP
jgi:hypothetical protein